MVPPVPDILLHKGREKSLRRRHPWVLSGAVSSVKGSGAPGDWARVLAASGETLGYGHYSPTSSLRVRMLAFGKAEVDELTQLNAAIERAVAFRTGTGAGATLLGETNAMRLINSEGDGLPGLVVDRYADTLVFKFTTAGMARLREPIFETLARVTGAAHGIERPDATAARRESFEARDATAFGEPSAIVSVRERDREYEVDLKTGQKTGFYLDQRDARDLVQKLASGRRVLDLFSYTGGFSVAALRGGASSVTAVDSSSGALAFVERNAIANEGEVEVARADAFEWMRACQDKFDLIVVDPPPLARSRRDVAKATRAYKDVTMHALRCAGPGAIVAVFACSHHIGPDLFRKVIFGAANDAGQTLQVLAEMGAPADHAVSLDHPEGQYLTGLVLRAEGAR